MRFIFRKIAKFISRWDFYIIKSLAFDPKNRLQLPINIDFVRHKTLELCCSEISKRNIKGNLAELGVYRGDFAVKINNLFSTRKLYLFDTFCFVSIDADLYEPILSELNFFYPRLEKNGYIFVHDFNNRHYKGVREAVIEYCETNNISFVPIPDTGGSVVITK